MLKQTVKYTDFNGDAREEHLYFNLTKTEMVDLELDEKGALSDRLDRIKKAEDAPAAYREFKEIVLFAYGIKSSDGQRFVKNEQVREDFRNSAAWDEFFFEMMHNAQKAADFVNGVVPAKQLEQAMAEAEKNRENNKRVLENLEEQASQSFRTPVPEPKKEPEPERGTFGQSLNVAGEVPSVVAERNTTAEPSPEEISEYLRKNPDALKQYGR